MNVLVPADVLDADDAARPTLRPLADRADHRAPRRAVGGAVAEEEDDDLAALRAPRSSGAAGLAGARGLHGRLSSSPWSLPEDDLATDVDFATVAPLGVLVTVVFSAAAAPPSAAAAAASARSAEASAAFAVASAFCVAFEQDPVHAGGRRERRVGAGVSALRAQRDEPDRAEERDRHQRDAERWGDLGHCPPHRLIGPIA